MIGGEIANFAAYAFAPAILVTPLGALSVLVSAVLASVMLKEELLLLGKVGCMLCIVGSTIIVLNAPEEQAVDSVEEISNLMLTNLGMHVIFSQCFDARRVMLTPVMNDFVCKAPIPADRGVCIDLATKCRTCSLLTHVCIGHVVAGFQLYAVMVVLLSLVLIFYAAPKWGQTNIMIYVTVCSLVGSLSVICVKGLGIALKLSFAGHNQMGEASTWVFVLLVLISVMTQMNYLNKALDTFNTAIVTPIYYVIFTTCTIVASTILFRGWSQGSIPDDTLGSTSSPDSSNCPDSTNDNGYIAGSLITCMCGFAVICTGVFLLHRSREEAQGTYKSPRSQRPRSQSSGRRVSATKLSHPPPSPAGAHLHTRYCQSSLAAAIIACLFLCACAHLPSVLELPASPALAPLLTLGGDVSSGTTAKWRRPRYH